MGYCVIKGTMCDWTTADGYCSVTACRDYDKGIPFKGMAYIPVEWLKTKTIEELYKLLEDWENNKWPQ